MKPTFHTYAVNGPFEDPCVYVRIIREGRGVLFDAGDLGRLESGNILKTTDIFVTHTHMDHFIGFDLVLRSILRRETPLRIFGPESITDCIEGKLKGYTWDLIKNYPVKIDVFEIREGFMYHAGFYAENYFRRTQGTVVAFNGVLMEDPIFSAKGLSLSHSIPVMAYSLEEESHININKVALADRGLPVGPWLSGLKKAIREGMTEDTAFSINGRTHALRELMDIVTITKGQKIAYVMDVAPTDENIEKITTFVKDADLFFCEAYFLEKDRDRAEKQNHLTAAIAGRIAREAGVRDFRVMHFSPRYKNCEQDIYQEAMREFAGASICFMNKRSSSNY